MNNTISYYTESIVNSYSKSLPIHSTCLQHYIYHGEGPHVTDLLNGYIHDIDQYSTSEKQLLQACHQKENIQIKLKDNFITAN